MDSDYYAGQAEQGVEGEEARLAESRARLDSAERQLATANEVHSAWLKLAGALGLVILVLLLYDAARMGALIRRCRAIEATLPPPREALVIERGGRLRSEEHTSELQSLMRISYAVFCLKKKMKSDLSSYIKTHLKIQNT